MNKEEMQDNLVDQLETYKNKMLDNFNSSRNLSLKNNMLAILVFAYQCKIIGDSELASLKDRFEISANI